MSDALSNRATAPRRLTHQDGVERLLDEERGGARGDQRDALALEQVVTGEPAELGALRVFSASV